VDVGMGIYPDNPKAFFRVRHSNGRNSGCGSAMVAPQYNREYLLVLKHRNQFSRNLGKHFMQAVDTFGIKVLIGSR
jgi:hypothetical protein